MPTHIPGLDEWMDLPRERDEPPDDGDARYEAFVDDCGENGIDHHHPRARTMLHLARMERREQP